MARKTIMKGGEISNNNGPFYIIITLLVSYIAFLLYSNRSTEKYTKSCSNGPPINVNQSVNSGVSSLDLFKNPYNPPLRNDFLSYFPGFGGYRGFNRDYGYGYNRPELDLRGSIPIPTATQGFPLDYTQVGILTQYNDDKYPLILPLMGRRSMSSRDKMNYYSMSDSGSLNTKLSVKRNGKSGTSEMGCEELYTGDEVSVDGHNTKFVSTIYENNSFQYVV
jgi:hypothetical protein